MYPTEIYPYPTVESGLERLASCKEAVIEVGIIFDFSSVLGGDHPRASASESLEKYIKSKSNFDRIFDGNDITVFEVLNVLIENGNSVPKDCIVIGFYRT